MECANRGAPAVGERDALQPDQRSERLDVGPVVRFELVVPPVGVHAHRLDAGRRLGRQAIVAQEHVELQSDGSPEGVAQQLVGVECALRPSVDRRPVAARRQREVKGRIVKHEALGVLKRVPEEPERRAAAERRVAPEAEQHAGAAVFHKEQARHRDGHATDGRAVADEVGRLAVAVHGAYLGLIAHKVHQKRLRRLEAPPRRRSLGRVGPALDGQPHGVETAQAALRILHRVKAIQWMGNDLALALGRLDGQRAPSHMSERPRRGVRQQALKLRRRSSARRAQGHVAVLHRVWALEPTLSQPQLCPYARSPTGSRGSGASAATATHTSHTSHAARCPAQERTKSDGTQR